MNLFELFVKVGVDDQASGPLETLAGKLGSGLQSAAKVGVAAVSAAAAGVTALTTAAVNNYAEYEQLVGGVDTLFKESSQKVQDYASKAFQTAGLSANEYMETVTSFSASLLQSTGRGEQTDLEALEDSLTQRYEATKESLSKEYDARKETLDAEVEAFKKARAEEFAAIDKNDKEARAKHKEQTSLLLADMKAANKKELAELKDNNTKKLRLQKVAIQDQVKAAEEANMVSVTTLESQELAAELANKAIIDMSDNANKMGTSMESIKNAYQGFAKANYTMLDNLKLGYGGTKEEMERLIEDANRLKEANGEMADLSISSFADIVEAIHLIQVEMDISGISFEEYTELVESGAMSQEEAFAKMGTTAKESASTIQGSVSTMKAAWDDFLTALADENADYQWQLDNLLQSVKTVAENVFPVVEQVLWSIGDIIDDVLPEIVSKIPQVISEVLPRVTELAVKLIESFVEGISQNQATITSAALEVGVYLITSLTSLLPQLAQLGMDILVTLAEGLAESIPQLVPTVTQVILEIARILTDPTSLGRIIEAAVTIIGELARGLVDAIPALVDTAIEIISGFVGFLVAPETLEPMLGGAESIVQSLATALTEAAVKLMEAAVALVAFLTEALTSEGNASKIATGALSVVLTLVNGIIAEADEMVEAAAALINALTIALLSPESLLEILRAAENLCIELSRGITESVFHIAEAGENAVQEFLDKFDGVDWEGLGLGWMEKIASGLSKGWSKVVEWLEGVREKILEYADFVRDAVNETIDAWKGEDNSPSIEDFSEELASFHEERIKAMKSGQISPGGYINPNAQPLGSTVNVTQNIYSSAKTPSELMTEAYYQQKLGAMN